MSIKHIITVIYFLSRRLYFTQMLIIARVISHAPYTYNLILGVSDFSVEWMFYVCDIILSVL